MDAGAAQQKQVKRRKETSSPPVPIKTYQWEDVRRRRKQGGYPWTHLDKPALDADQEIDIEQLLTDPPEMSQEILELDSSPSSNRRMADKILTFDSSPGSKRKLGAQEILELDSSPGSARKQTAAQEILDLEESPGSSRKLGLEILDLEESPGSSRKLGLEILDLEQSPGSSRKLGLEILDLEESPGSARKLDRQEIVDLEESPRSSKKLADDDRQEIVELEESPRSSKRIAREDVPQEIVALEDSPGNARKLKTAPQEIIDLDESPSSSRKIVERTRTTSTSSQKILNLKSSPLSNRKHDEVANIPQFSKEISLDSEEDSSQQISVEQILPNNLRVMTDAKVSVSPKSILKRKYPPEQQLKLEPLTDESPRNSKCCHPIVEKIKHIADKTIHKPEREKTPKRELKEEPRQEIIPLEGSPGTERRERKMAAELDNTGPEVTISMVMRRSLNDLKDKTHEYEEMETKSGDSKDPSLAMSEPMDEDDETVMKLRTMYDTSMTVPDDLELRAREDETNHTPKLTIEEVRVDDDVEEEDEEPVKVAIELAPSDKASDDGDDFWSKMGDHEYEPIGKPVSEASLVPPEEEVREEAAAAAAQFEVPVAAAETPPPPILEVSNHENYRRRDDDASSTASHERQLLRPATDEDHSIVDSLENPSPEPGGYSTIALQKEMEDAYFRDTPTTPESKTDCEISTSQVDSSALENLPLKKENRKRSSIGMEAAKMQQRIKSQTGKLKTKLKTIKKPQFNLPERPKFNLPERPKFNMPERPKFNMPERPKFNMPERPKFNMPERPKFTMPERPKFNMPERPKFNMPERPKFKMPERPKFNMPDRPKFNFPDKSKFRLPDRSKFKLPDKSKIFPSFGRNKENEQQDFETSTGESSSTPKRKILDFDFRTYPRLSKLRKDKKASKSERPGTPPPGFSTFPHATKDRKAIISTPHWDGSNKSASEEEPRQYGLPKNYPTTSDREFQSKLAQVDKDYNEMQEEYRQEQEHIQSIAKAKLENAEIWNAMERSSVQRLEHKASLPEWPTSVDENPEDQSVPDDRSSAASADDHRRGVLEEIDNDEFFLRQKGISQDNIEVGKYLTDEIRDAFRSPVNALSQMNGDKPPRVAKYVEVVNIDNDDFDRSNEYIDEDLDNEPENMMEHDDGYYTFPPVRPSRSRKLKALEIARQSAAAESVPTPPKFQDSLKRQDGDKEEPQRKSLFSSTFKDTDVLDNLNEYENEIEQTRELPMAPKRNKKSLKDLNASQGELFNGSYEPEKWMAIKSLSDKSADDEIVVHRLEYVMPTAASPDLPEESPIPPRRNRSRSRGSRATSACDDDRTSRGAESLTMDSHAINVEDFPDFIDDTETYPGYAVVEKVATPKKVEPPPRPAIPIRRRRSTKSLTGERQFFTVPRSLKDSSPPPKRPLRTYSTLGPSRPPRKKASTSLQSLQKSHSTSNIDSTQYVEIDDDLDLQRDLKSGEIVSKMKYRPLPPPPRPPRGPKKKRDPDDKRDDDEDFVFHGEVIASTEEIATERDVDVDVEEEMAQDVRVETVQDVEIEVGILDEKIPYDEYDHDEIVEIEVSTQTDPLPDDFDYTIGMDEPFADIQKEEEPEENSIDAEVLSKGLQRFRESSRPSSRPNSRTSRSRTPGELKSSIERPKTPLGRMSPTAILVERRVSSPTRINERDEIVTEASLTVLPIDEPEIKEVKAESYSKHPPSLEMFNIPTESAPQPMPPPRKSSIQEDRPAQPKYEPQPQIAETQPQPAPERPEVSQPLLLNPEVEVLRTQKLQVTDLEVERLNVSELQASKILVSEIEGLSLNVSDINSKAGNIVVSGIHLAPGIFDELLQRFAQMVPPSAPASTQTTQTTEECEEQPQPETKPSTEEISPEIAVPSGQVPKMASDTAECPESPPIVASDPEIQDLISTEAAPQRPPLPSNMQYMPYYPEYPEGFYRYRQNADKPPQAEYSGHEGETANRHRRRRVRREPTSSSDDEARPSTSRRPPQQQARVPEPSIADLSSQLFRACHSSMFDMLRCILSYISSQFGSSGENKKDMQMALVIVLVMIAGLILLGVGDGRTVHHHHWDFYNPPSNEK